MKTLNIIGQDKEKSSLELLYGDGKI